TFLASLVALSFCRCVSTTPLMVTTPFATATSSAPPFTSASPASRMRTLSLMALSVTGWSAARHSVTASNRATNARAILEIIFTGHCTPVERVEKGVFFPPAGLHADVKVEIDLHSKEMLHLDARRRADALQRGALRADDDALLASTFHADRRINPR